MDSELDDVFDRLSRSSFRRRFRLRAVEKDYLDRRGLDTVMSHDEKFIEERLAPADPANDGPPAKEPEMPAYDLDTIRGLVTEVRKPKSQQEFDRWLPQTWKDIRELYLLARRSEEWESIAPTLDDARELHARASRVVKLGKAFLKAIPPHYRDPKNEQWESCGERWHFLDVESDALRDMYLAFERNAQEILYLGDHGLTPDELLYRNRHHFSLELANAIGLTWEIAKDAAELASIPRRTAYTFRPIRYCSLDSITDVVDRLNRAVSILGEALADLQPESSPVPVARDEMTGGSPIPDATSQCPESTPSSKNDSKVPETTDGANSVPANPLDATLDQIARGPLASSLIRFLAGSANRSSTLQEVSRHIYKSRSKSCIKKTSRLINRTRELLEARETTLRIVRDRNVIKLIDC
jgi:hypothetical protein